MIQLLFVLKEALTNSILCLQMGNKEELDPGSPFPALILAIFDVSFSLFLQVGYASLERLKLQ